MTAAGNGMLRFRDPTLGFTLDYPDDFHLSRAIDPGGGMIGPAPAVAISNHEDLGRTIESLADFPSDGVVMRLWYREGRVASDTPLPLPLSGFKQIDPYRQGDSEPPPLYRSLYIEGRGASMAIWVGPDASAEDRARIEAVATSLREPPVHQGPQTDGSYVVGPASGLAVGGVSLVELDPTTSPAPPVSPGPLVTRSAPRYFLVHAPGGFYTVSGWWGTGDGETCKVEFEQKRLAFRCGDVIFDRQGFPQDDQADPPLPGLGVRMAYVSWDGMIIAYEPPVAVPPIAGLPWRENWLWTPEADGPEADT